MSPHRRSSHRTKAGRGRSKTNHSSSGRRTSLDRRPFEAVIERLSHDGRGIAVHQGKTLFVAGALPGERVTVGLIADHSRFGEAEVIEWLDHSVERVQPDCPHYQRCGGCNLQHYHSQSQLTFKQASVLDQLQRWAGVVPGQLLPAIESPMTGYRQRARFSVWYERDGSLSLGFREEGSKRLVHIEHCLVLDPSLNALLMPFQCWLEGLQARRAVSHMELIASANGPACVIRHTQPFKAADLEALAALSSDEDVEIWLQPQSKGEANSGLTGLDGRVCDPRLHYKLPEFDLHLGFHPQDFTQVNSLVNRAMVNQALSLLAPASDTRVLDLFCGIGNFTLPLARRAGRVIGVEAADSMVLRGRENARAHNLDNLDFVAANLEAESGTLVKLAAGFESVLLDPPRAGARGVMPLIQQLSAERIVYVSCNPATLARDTRALADLGYSLETLGVMDMFPHTAHIESMALFSR